MTDPNPTEKPGQTPEEDWLTRKMRDPDFVKGFIDEMHQQCEDDIRAAVEAETERAASVNPASIQCPKCVAEIGMPCESLDDRNRSWIPPHLERWRAAIRAKP